MKKAPFKNICVAKGRGALIKAFIVHACELRKNDFDWFEPKILVIFSWTSFNAWPS